MGDCEEVVGDRNKKKIVLIKHMLVKFTKLFSKSRSL
jgi:hypothetical protein